MPYCTEMYNSTAHYHHPFSTYGNEGVIWEKMCERLVEKMERLYTNVVMHVV